MTYEDVQECTDLFLRAHGANNGWDRKPDITGLLAADFPLVMCENKHLIPLIESVGW